MAQRLKVLISAYACEPHKGSEPEAGWQWALQMARFHDVTVLTRSNNRPAIEAAVTELRGRQPTPNFVYHDRHPLLMRLKREFRGTKTYYLLWQKSARKVVNALHQAHQFDLMHHVTFAGYRYPIAIWGHGVASIWGPIGGIESIPFPLLPWHHPVSLGYEMLRNISNLVQATPNYVLPKRARATTLILASTREMQSTFAKLGFAAELMPTIGLTAAELPFSPRSDLPTGPLKILFVGNIITLKGIDLALEALSQSKSDATLTLIGDGNYLEAAKELARKLGLAERVTFTGRRPRAEVLKTYAQYDLFVFPSLHDTGGYAVIEAMFNELPVICLDCGGPAIAVQAGCGTKVALGPRAQVIADLAEAIRLYDRDRNLIRAQGRAAREVVLKEYDWNAKGERMNGRYQEVVTRFREQKGREGGSKQGLGALTTLLHGVLSFRGFVVGTTGLLLIGALMFLSISSLKKQARLIVDDTLPGLSYAGEANASMAQAFTRTLLMLMANTAEERNGLRQEIEDFNAQTSGYLAAYCRQIHFAEDRLLYETVLSRRKDYLRVREAMLELLRDNRTGLAVTLCNETLLPAYRRYKESADELFQYNIRQGQSRGNTIMGMSTATQFIVAAIGIGIFLVGFLIGISR